MRTIIRMLGVSIFWIAISMMTSGVVVNILGVNFIPTISGIVAGISVLYPDIFDMGLAKYAKANIYEKMFPIFTVGIILFISRWFVQTSIVACVTSYYIGVCTAYISKVVTDKLERAGGR